MASSSSQSTLSIPFSSAHAQQAFKLIELPPELLVLLESDNPPTLSITSSSSSSSSTTTTPGYATLCFGDKKYQMRQKNTSNPILILQPSTSISSRSTKPPPTDTIDEDAAAIEEEGEEGDPIPTPALRAIAKCEDTIELVLQLPEEEEKKVERKINKWHEKFAKSRKVEK